MQKKHIDDVQSQTVNEHYKLFLKANEVIDSSAPDVTPNDLPDWYNEKLYKEGQNFYKRNMLSIEMAYFIGLMTAIVLPTLQKMLLFTKRSSSVPMAFKRYMETTLHICNISTCDANDIDSKWYKSMNRIRWHHKIASQRARNGGAVGITQGDMVLVQYCFAALIYIVPESFGLCNTLEEDEAFNHFWRVNGYMLGIPDKLNLCRKNAKETTELCHKIKDLCATYFNKAPPEFYDISTSILDAFWYINFIANIDSVLSLTYKIYNLSYKKLGWYNWLIVKFIDWLFYLYLVPYVGAVAKLYGNFLTKFVFWNMEHFPVFVRMKFGKNNVQLNLFPKV